MNIIPEPLLHGKRVVSENLLDRPCLIKEMVPSIADPDQKSNDRDEKQQNRRPFFQDIDSFRVQESHQQPQCRNKGQAQVLNLVPKDHFMGIATITDHDVTEQVNTNA